MVKQGFETAPRVGITRDVDEGKPFFVYYLGDVEPGGGKETLEGLHVTPVDSLDEQVLLMFTVKNLAQIIKHTQATFCGR